MAMDIYVNLKSAAESAKKALDNAAKSTSKLGRETKTTNSGMAKFFSTLKKTNNQFTNISKDANRAASSLSGFGKAVKNLATLGGIYGLANALKIAIQSSLDMIETQNLFVVALGDSSDAAEELLTTLSDASGMDLTNLKSATGTFALLARSMGFTSQQAETLSTSSTQLALDLASLVNVPVSQALADIKSGLIGQTETMYKYGVDLTEASLKSEALAEGIDKSVRLMSQGEKMALRYNLMIKQTALSHGDFAKTIDSPANQLKILSERFVTAGRAIGTIFIPTLTVILPIANAVLIVITKLANAIATLFGYIAPDSAATGISNISEDADDATDAIGGTTAALKKLKDTSLGFDELHTIETDSSASGGGGTSSDNSSILANALLDSYNSMLDNIKQTADIFAKKIQPFIETILETVIAIGLVILGWKIATVANNILGLSANFKAFSELTKEFGFSKALGALMPKEILKTLGGLALIVGGLVLAFKGFNGILTESEPSLKNYALAISGIILVAAGLALVFTPVVGIIALVVGGLALLGTALYKHFSDVPDAVKQVDLFGDVSEETKEKVSPFIDAITDLDDTFATLDFGNEIITDDVITNLQTKMDSIVSTITTAFETAKTESLENLKSIKDNLSGDEFSNLANSIDEYYEKSAENVQAGEDRINEILNNAKNDNRDLRDEELSEIQAIQDSWQDIGIQSISGNAIEYESIMRKLKDNTVGISVNQASEIIKNAKETEESTIASAENQYSSILLNAENLRDAGIINEEEYQNMTNAAKEAHDSTIEDAENQFSTIKKAAHDNLGEMSKYIDDETGNIKTNWDIFTEDIKTGWTNFWIDMGVQIENGKQVISDKFDEIKNGIKNLPEWFDKTVVTPISDLFNGMVNGIIGVFEGMINGIIKGLNSFIGKVNGILSKINSAADALGFTIDLQFNTIDPVVLPRLAQGGILKMGTMFEAGENGKAEMLGNYNGSTTVMPLENTDFVQAMYDAVASAITDTQESGGQVIENILNLDGDVIYRNQQKVSQKRGQNFGLGAFAR